MCRGWWACGIRFHMLNFRGIALLSVFAFTAGLSVAAAQTLAPTPPMGWNSWDAYGLTINEADFKANTEVLAGIKQYGWQYSVIDEGWYMEDPFAGTREKQKYVYDEFGRLIPALNRFPDAANAAGLKPLADWVHGQGLKFGIHLIRGIPRHDLEVNSPIAGSKFMAADAGDTTDACPWDDGNWGVKDNAAGQAWYDSMIDLYGGWGVDFLKVDCISDHPYKPVEIRLISEAIRKFEARSGKQIVLSLSPGPTNLRNAAYVAKYAQMWRIADDHWDVWSHVPEAGKGEFPLGTRQAFDRLEAWQPYVKPGSWPDDDMLPFGSLTPHPGWGEPRESRLTEDEERTEFTLWAITRSPLILGANLTKMDAFLRGLVTDKELLDLNQSAWESHPVKGLPAGFENVRVWQASEEADGNPRSFIALFNLGDKPVSLRATWAQLGQPGKFESMDLFSGKRLAKSDSLGLTLPAHGSAIYRVQGKLTLTR